MENNITRVDFFKPSGKWAYTHQVKWLDCDANDLREALRQSIVAQFGPKGFAGFIAVCLDPPNKWSCPVMIET